ncbi:cation diffusion facilitator family transporter [Thaumasiovibrio subtropicus]|uniref:cation diffusion facilitator family transporter n=1 Tax=Thaumasiovibrio subtropicus TaxID=1891207 RepID=UPI00131EADA4|nr:cation transporter [Thaumasiovibrio subtropicus]
MQERKLIIISIAVTLFFSVIGIFWGILSDSSMIMFDGIYSLFSVALSGLSLIVLHQMSLQTERDEIRFPFGKAHFEPLLIVFKSLTLIGMCSYSMAGAVSDLLSGGAAVEPGPAILYAAISTMGCGVIAVLLRERNKRIGSPLLDAEKNQWLGDLLLSIGVLMGFTVAYQLEGTRWHSFTEYADPLMVLLASSVFIFLPLKSLFSAGKELMLVRIADNIAYPINQIATEYAKQLNSQYKLRMVAVGRELNIELNFFAADEVNINIAKMDEIRMAVAEAAELQNKKHWINVNFTAQTCWV